MGIGNAFSALLNKLSGKPQKPRFTSAVILAGGSSTRMGKGVSKQWLTLDGIPVIVRSLLIFEACDMINEIILVAKADEFARYEALREKYSLKKLTAIVEGGEDRQTSAQNGFHAASETADFVAIHDGARCLITVEEIESVCRAAFSTGAATAATRVNDSVKLATDSGYIESTVDRSKVWLAQTPQVFSTAVYHAALAVTCRDYVKVTDDCSLAEYIQHPVRLVPCSADNIKLTVPEDIARAEAILAARKQEDAL